MQNATHAAEKVNRNYDQGIFCLQEAANCAILSCARIPPSELLPLLEERVAERVEETIRKQPCLRKPTDQLPSEDEIAALRVFHSKEYEDLVALLSCHAEYNLTVFFDVSDDQR